MWNVANPTQTVKKLQVEETVQFAIRHIPQANQNTLQQFLELVNTGGTFGSISHEQIVRKMGMVLKHIPNACARSLMVLLDLLEIEMVHQPALASSSVKQLEAGAEPDHYFIQFAAEPMMAGSVSR